MKRAMPPLFIFILVIVFFYQYFIKGLFPIPADTIVGLYHPFRDLYVKDYPRGIPFKNFLITDPVRQQYPWRKLAVSMEKNFKLPLWNPYNFSGTPLLANLQSAAFYPFNLLLFFLPFPIAWSFLIFLGSLLGGIFLFLYLDNLKISKWGSFIGAVAFSFSGFFVSWMEWGTITHVALWLPLVLLAIDKIFAHLISENSKVKSKNLIFWGLILILSSASSFFAGHLQTFFYLLIFSLVYLLVRWWQYGKNVKIIVLFAICYLLFAIVTAIQWLPTLQFIFLSARGVDQVSLESPGWFIPWQHLVQFVVPDYFGNPATLNYWGVWNYGELAGYVGIIPLVFSIFSLLFRRDKKTLFFAAALFASLLFSLPTFFAKIPFVLKIPLFDTAQPTRLLFITSFSLAVLSALGFDSFLKIKNKRLIFVPLIFIGVIIMGLWIFIPNVHFSVVKSNLLLPTILFTCSAVLFFLSIIFLKKNALTIAIYTAIIGITVFDLFRFGWKFTPFTNANYLFPQTKALSFLQKKSGNFRIMTTDSRILPPNFSIAYRLQSVDGYDPLYLRRYGELIAASERGRPNVSPPFGFNRIITPHNYESKIMDLLGVKYVLSLSDLKSEKLKKIFQEGQTRIYENKNVLPRVFFTQQAKTVDSKGRAISAMFDRDFDFMRMAVVEDSRDVNASIHTTCSRCEAEIIWYSENKVIVRTEGSHDGFLVLTDTFYPTWNAKIDEKETKIFRTNYNFRGLVVPAGKHSVEFYNLLL